MIPAGLLLFGSFLLGVLFGFAVRLLLGEVITILLALFLSGTHELNEFWLGYIVGVFLAEALRYYLEKRDED